MLTPKRHCDLERLGWPRPFKRALKVTVLEDEFRVANIGVA